jgi:hypothetical protein
MIYRARQLRSYDSAPRHPLPLSRQQDVSLSQSFCVNSQSSLLTGVGGGGCGRGAKLYDLRNAWPSINHAILPGSYEYLKIEAAAISTTEIRERAQEYLTTSIKL